MTEFTPQILKLPTDKPKPVTIRDSSVNKIQILIICLAGLTFPNLSFSEYPDQNHSNLITQSHADSTVVITDSLIAKEANLKNWQRGLVLGLSVAYVPVGIINGISLALIPETIINFEPLGRAALIIPIGYMFAYPIFVGWGTFDLLNKEAKHRLLEKYEGYKIIDSSSIKSKYIPSYSIFLGINYSTFLTDDVKSKVDYTCGVRYNYRLTRHLSLATAIQISKRDITISNKICKCYIDQSPTTYKIVDMKYNTVDIYFPIYLKFSVEINDKQSLYLSAGTGFPIALPLQEDYVHYENTDINEYDYIKYDGGLIPYSNPMYSLNIGLSAPKYYYEFEITQDFNYRDRSRNIEQIAFTEKFIVFQFIVGYQIPIR